MHVERGFGGAGKIPAISIAGPGPTPSPLPPSPSSPPVAPFLSYIRCLYSVAAGRLIDCIVVKLTTGVNINGGRTKLILLPPNDRPLSPSPPCSNLYANPELTRTPSTYSSSSSFSSYSSSFSRCRPEVLHWGCPRCQGRWGEAKFEDFSSRESRGSRVESI